MLRGIFGKTRVLLSLMLVVIMVLTVATGCSGNTNGAKPAASTEQPAQSEKPAQSEQPTQSVEAKRGKVSVTIYDRGKVPANEGTIEENRWTEWLNENGPVDVEFVAIQREEGVQKLSTLFAAGSAPDIILEYDNDFKTTLYNQKQLMPLDELVDEHSVEYKNLLETYPALKKAGMMEDGKLYHIGRINEVYPKNGIVIREDWLQKLDLDVPKTLDDFLAVAIEFTTKDPDGNGANDTFGVNLSHWAQGVFYDMFGISIPYRVNEDKLEYAWENLGEMVAFQKKLYDAGVVDKDYLTDNKGEKALQDFVNGKLGMYMTSFNWASFFVKEYKMLQDNVPDARIVPVQLPKTYVGQFNPFYNDPVQKTGVVNAAAKDPEAVMKYIDFMVSVEAGTALLYGLEGEHFQMGPNGPEIIDQDKYNQEVSWIRDATMLFTRLNLGISGTVKGQFNPEEKEAIELWDKVMQVYTDTSIEYSGITHVGHFPGLPSELQVVAANLTISDIVDTTIVGGASHPVDKAMEDAKDMWEKGGGQQIEEFYSQWYQSNQSSALMAKDIYDIMKEQLKQFN